MHICFVSMDFHEKGEGGGIASYVQTLAEKFISMGHHVSVIAQKRGIRKPQCKKSKGIKILFWPFWPLGSLHWYWYRMRVLGQWPVLPLREIEWSFTILRAVRWLHYQQPIDILESTEIGNMFLHHVDVPLIIRLHGEPFVFQKYSGESLDMGLRFSRRFQLAAMKRAAALTSPSHFQAGEVAHDLNSPQTLIKAIPNPIHPWFLDQAKKNSSGNRRQELEGDGNIVLYTGRIEYRKGTLPFLRSIPSVYEKIPNVTYIIAGGRHNSIDDLMLNQVLGQGNIRRHVRFLGHIPWEKLSNWYRRAAVFVMPSYYETFGISCLEAMAFGLPVVATTAGGLPEVVEDGVTGILVPPGDAKSLGEAIAILLSDSALRKRMGQAGRHKVMAEYTSDRIAEKTLNLYAEVKAF